MPNERTDSIPGGQPVVATLQASQAARRGGEIWIAKGVGRPPSHPMQTGVFWLELADPTVPGGPAFLASGTVYGDGDTCLGYPAFALDPAGDAWR